MARQPNKDRLLQTIAHVDSLLHNGCFVELERLSGGKRLTAEQIKLAIEEYPEKLTTRPSYEIDDNDVIRVTGSAPAEWSVYLHLWRKDGGRSDLTAELTLIETDTGYYRVEIDNIHVL